MRAGLSVYETAMALGLHPAQVEDAEYTALRKIRKLLGCERWNRLRDTWHLLDEIKSGGTEWRN